jgi:hypothetical protein
MKDSVFNKVKFVFLGIGIILMAIGFLQEGFKSTTSNNFIIFGAFIILISIIQLLLPKYMSLLTPKQK